MISSSWERILATGHYPAPKSSSTLIDDQNGNLILFGGRSMICIDGVHLREQLHSELHAYSLERNTWTLHASLNEPGPICEHSASMVGRRMIVFGGSIVMPDQTVAQPSNDLWEWTDDWRKLSLDEGVKPEARKGPNYIRGILFTLCSVL